MKLIFDARYIREDYHDGISRYSHELAQALWPLAKAQGHDLVFLVCSPGQAAQLPEGAATIAFHAPTSIKEPLSALLLNRHRPDVVFSPMQTIGSGGKKFRLLLTVHDLIYYRHPTPPHHAAWPLRVLWRLYHASFWPQKLLLRGADRLVCVSHTTKEEVVKANLFAGPITVVHNAAPALPAPTTPTKSTPGRTLVYMGSFMPYKNVERLIAALEFLPDAYTLHLLSRVSDKRRRRLQARVPHGRQVIFHDGVSDREYAELLTGGLLVSGSLDEGYGIPLAEAQTLGTPVACSDIAIFREVAGEGALYFNPHDPRDIAATILAATVPTTYEALSQAASRQSRRFSWEKSAETLLAAMEYAAP